VLVSELRQRIEVRTPIEAAFTCFVDDIGDWWPREYTWADQDLAKIAIEPKQGGRCYERSLDGRERIWGRVLEWEPPGRFVFSWQIAPDRRPIADPDDASQVEVSFRELEDEMVTGVELVHRGFERHGEAGDGYREALAGERGWSYILERYAAAASG
jgi:uncharacterized protein YndB with AHSA1/START domain